MRRWIQVRRWMSTHVEKHLEQLRSQGDKEGYANLVRQCAEDGRLEDGKLVHKHLVMNGYAGDTFIGNLLIDMYSKCGDSKLARAAFDSIRDKNIFSWTILVTASAKCGNSRSVFKLVQTMELEGVKPEKVIYLGLVDACAKLLELSKAKRVHLRIKESGWDENLVVGNAIVSMYGRCGDFETARDVFDALPEKTVVSWNAVIGAYARNGQGKDALQMLKRMDLEGIKPDRITFLSVVEACTTLCCLSESKLAYSRVVASGFDSDVAVGTSLVNMYGKSGSVADAKAAFDSMGKTNTVTWNVMMAAYNQCGEHQEALKLFSEMKDDVRADRVSFINALDASVGLKSLARGREIHNRASEEGLDSSDLVVGNAVMNMYSKCGSPEDARSVFRGMHTKDIVSWNTLVASFARNGFGIEAIEVFHEMVSIGISPDKYTFISALDACCSFTIPTRGIQKGREIHERLKGTGFMSDASLVTVLIKMYGKFGLVKEARKLFDGMSKRVGLTWSRMITAYGQNGYGQEAIELYKKIDIPPDKVTLASVLDACASVLAIGEGRGIHKRIVEERLEKDIVVDNTLLDLYGQCGSVEEAECVFESMPEKDVISWNAIIRANLFSERPQDALRYFSEMQVNKDRVSYVSALDACASMGAEGLPHGKAIHEEIIADKVDIELFVGTALVTMYGRCGSIEDAKHMFDDIKFKNTVTWTSMMRGYSANGLFREAVKTFWNMEQEGCPADKLAYIAALEACKGLDSVVTGEKLHSRLTDLGLCSDSVVQSALVTMYGKFGYLETARGLFDSMHERCVVSWNTMIAAYARRGDKEQVLSLFKEMLNSHIKPERATYLGILNISGFSGEEARRIEDSIRENSLETDCLVGTALLNTHVRSGKLGEARKVFDSLIARDLVSWTSIIMGYASHGEGREALELFKEMQVEGVLPDDVIFVGVLSACSHAGKSGEGWEYLVSMRGDYGIEPLADHYCCMVDLLGKAGKLAEAEDLICSMPFKPDEATWTALVGACQIHGDAERAARVARGMECDDQVVPPHILLSNTYASSACAG